MLTQVFISYAHDDNEPPAIPDKLGFVTRVQQDLRHYLKQLGPPSPTFWQDMRRIAGADQFETKIDEGLIASSVLFVILSRNWLNSTWCQRELEAFTKSWEQKGDSNVRQRIVVILKNHVEIDQRNPALQGQVGYRFYELDRDDHVNSERCYFEWGDIARGYETQYYSTIKSVAYHLRELCKRTNTTVSSSWESKSASDRAPTRGRTLYVAKPASDMRVAYDRVVAELHGRGYFVVPPAESELPGDITVVDTIKTSLSMAEASIHLLGNKYGPAPEDTAPIAKLQLTLAAEAMAGHEPSDAKSGRTFHQIIWAPKTLTDASTGTSDDRDPFAVLNEFHQYVDTDKVEGNTISDFIDFLLQHLERATAPQEHVVEEIDSDSNIYIYHALDDTQYALSVARALKQQRVRPILPAYGGRPPELRALHRKELRHCDAVLICCANASEAWVKAHARELRWQDLRRSQKFKFRGLVAGPPPDDRKVVLIEMPPPEFDVVLDLTEHDLAAR